MTPEVGMGVTECLWSDRHAGTIVRVSESGKTFWYRSDRAIRIDKNGMSESQQYLYEPDPNAEVRAARLTKRGWMSKGTRISVGVRSEYYDYTF